MRCLKAKTRRKRLRIRNKRLRHLRHSRKGWKTM
jgi:hypothetical protein